MMNPKLRRALIWIALPLVAYTLVALVITWPVARHLDSQAAGAGYGDAYEALRNGWWFREALVNGENPFHQDLLAYPDGVTSWVQWSQPLQQVPLALLGLVVSPLAAYNLVLILTLVLNGLTAYWLGLDLNGRRVAPALLGGLVFAAFPAAQGHLVEGHLVVVTVWAVPLYARYLWRVLRAESRWRDVLWGGVWLALVATMSAYALFLVLIPLTVLLGGYLLLWERCRLFLVGMPRTDQPWLRAGVMLVCGGLLILPFYVPMLTGAGRAELHALRETGVVRYSADPLAFVSPSPFGLLDDVGLVPDYARDVLGTNLGEGTAYLGVIVVALALVAVVRRREARPWLVVALGAMVLALGPLLKWRDAPVVVQIEDLESYVTLPWALIRKLPVYENTRTPARAMLATGLALSVLVSLGAAAIRVRRRVVQGVAVIVVGALILVEYQVFSPFATDDARQPDYFDTLAAQDDVRAVLNVPVEHHLAAKFALYQQTIHRQAMIGGHVLRRSPQDPAVLAILGRAGLGAPPDGTLPLPDDAVPYVLSQAGADRVIVHRQFLPPEGQDAVQRLRAILGAPDYVGEKIATFAVPRTPEPPPDVTLVTACGVNGWSDAVVIDGAAMRFLADAGEWHLFAPEEVFGELVIPVAPYRVSRPLRVWLDDHLIDGWPGGAGAFRLPLWLSPGFHTLRFEAVDGCTDFPFALTCWDADPLSEDCVPRDPPACISSALGVPRWEPAASLPQAVEAAFAGGLRLRGVTLNVAPDESALHVRLFWQAERTLPGNLALFVHVSDPATDVPQVEPPYSDYPQARTDDWPAGARWQSTVTIPLPDGLRGEYAVNAGWFDPASGTRLVLDGGGDILRLGVIQLGGDAGRPLD